MRNTGLIRDIMTTDLKVVQLHTPFSKIKEIFDTETFHHLPVVDNMAMIKGIITKNDLAHLTYQMSLNTGGEVYSKKWYEGLKAKDVMTKNPVVVNPEDSVELAADLFLENVYHALPVMEDGVLVGIVTSHDLLVYTYYRPPVEDL